MDIGVPQIDGNRISAVNSLDLLEAVGHIVEGFVPPNGSPGATGSAHGLPQTIRVVVNVLEGNGFGADVATAEWVIPVSPDGYDLATSNVDHEPTDRFTQIAGSEVGLGVVSHDSERNCTRTAAELV